MKAAYIAYDQNSLSAFQAMAPYFKEIDFYLVEKDRPVTQIDFDQLGIVVDHLNIPAEPSQQTLAHKRAFSTLKKEFNLYKSQLSVEAKRKMSAPTAVGVDCKMSVENLSVIHDVVMDSKNQQVSIEKEKVGVTKYNYLFIEEHQILSEEVARFGDHVFRRRPQNSHVWLTLEYDYELKKPREGHLGHREFILIEDRLNQSVLDNWHLLRMQDFKIRSQQWVPYHHFKNSDFQKFMIDRVEKTLKEKIDLIQINGFSQFFVDATSGFFSQKASLRNAKLSSLVPSFNLSSTGKIQAYLGPLLESKMKDLQKLQIGPEAGRGQP